MKTFPIQGTWSNKQWKYIPSSTIPWSAIAPHEDQALKNHCGQDLERLAAREGLSHCEAVAVIEDRDWRLMDLEEAIARLDALVSATPPKQ